MRKIHTILRHHHQAGLSQCEISRCQKIGYGTVGNYLSRARNAGLSWPLLPDMDERALELALFPDQRSDTPQRRFAEPDFARIYVELKSPLMTKQLAWEEYRQIHVDDGYSYSQFCRRYRTWQGR